MKKLLFLIATGLLSLSNIHSQEKITVSPDIELYKLSENVFLHVSYTTLPAYGRISANGLVITDKGKALLLDTPWNDSLTRELTGYLTGKMGLKIDGFIPNHWHEDCMGGLGCLKSLGIRSYANFRTIEIAGQKGLPLPDVGFSDSLTVNAGGIEARCYFPGAAHSTDNIVVWIPSEKILFAGCMCKSIDSKDLGNTADGSLLEYPSTIATVIRKYKNAEIIIPGHGSPGGFELLQHTKSLADTYSKTLLK